MMTLGCLIFSPRLYRQDKGRGVHFVWLFPASVRHAVLCDFCLFVWVFVVVVLGVDKA